MNPIFHKISLLVILFVVGVSFALLSKDSKTRIIEQDLNYIVNEPSWIFVAKIDQIDPEPIIYDNFGALGKVRLKLIMPLKGTPFTIGGEDGLLEFLFRPDMPDATLLELGDMSVFFWKNTMAGPILLAGHYGVKKIDEAGCISTFLVDGLSARTSVSALQEIINAATEVGGDLMSLKRVKNILADDYCMIE